MLAPKSPGSPPSPALHLEHGHGPGFWRRWIFSTDHKVIGLQYLLTGLLMSLLGGYLSYLFRMQLAFPGQPVPGFGVLDAPRYNTFVTMHGTIMIFWVAMPVLLAAFGNLLIPTMIGTRDMAFPTLNMISYWTFFVSSVVLVASFFVPGGAFGGGWTAYPPLSADAYRLAPFWEGLGGDLWILAVALEFVAFLMGGINFLTTSINMRAPGMTLMRLPMVVWMLDLATLVFMFSVGPLIAGAVMLLADRVAGTGFYNPAAGGDPLLFQHLFWFFGHPEVYVMLLPTVGFVAEIFATHARKPLFGYKLILWSAIVACGLSFIVWAHHQFIAGIDPRVSNFFSLTTLLISVPFAIIVFALIATLWGGQIEFSPAMLFAVGMVGEFLIGGVTGIYLGASAFDIYAHDTYFVIAHFHYALIPVVIFGGAAAIYFWYPKFTGRMMNPLLGVIHFWGTCVFFNIVFMPLFFAGLAGQQRRIFDYTAFPSLNTNALHELHQIATFGLFGLMLSQLPFMWNLVASLWRGASAPDNPWAANTLEWSIPSPPPHGNFTSRPTVFRGPYHFSEPGRERDFWPQTEATEA
jgi:cytochrome c oxidase subunit 1